MQKKRKLKWSKWCQGEYHAAVGPYRLSVLRSDRRWSASLQRNDGYYWITVRRAPSSATFEHAKAEARQLARVALTEALTLLD